MTKLDKLIEAYVQLEEVSPEWMGRKLGGALVKIQKAGAKPGMDVARGKYNRVMKKAMKYTDKKYTGKMHKHMTERFNKALKGASPRPKELLAPNYSPHGWKDPAFV